MHIKFNRLNFRANKPTVKIGPQIDIYKLLEKYCKMTVQIMKNWKLNEEMWRYPGFYTNIPTLLSTLIEGAGLSYSN